MIRSFLLSLTCIMTVLLACSGCSSGRRVQPLEFPYGALDKAVEETNEDPIFDNSTNIPLEWWTLFDDCQLTEFIRIAFDRNPTLQQAQANIALAESDAAKLRSILFPHLLWGADVSRQKFSETGIIPFHLIPPGMGGVAPVPFPATGGINAIPVYFTQYETQLNFTYDFDIWGKNRQMWQAAIGEIQSKRADEVFARLQLGIAVAQVYFRLQFEYQRQEIAQMQVNSRTSYLDLVQKRLQGNLDNILQVQSAEISVAQAKQFLLVVQNNIAVHEHQLKTYLAGSFNEEFDHIQIMQKPMPKVSLPENLPLHLLAYRPDIMAQLWLIQSAGHQIESAKAGFYPDISLAAVFGYQTLHLDKLFLWKSSNFNVDPAISLPIFDGGRLAANLRGSEVNYDLAILEYNKLILNATREVLDGISILRNSELQYQEFRKMTEFQNKIAKFTELRTTGHLNSDLDTLSTTSSVLTAREQEVTALGNTIQAMLSLIKALGGGYDACNEQVLKDQP